MLALPLMMRGLLSRPLGVLFLGDSIWQNYLNSILKGAHVATVGDVVTQKFVEHTNATPNIAVIDGRTKRKTINTNDKKTVEEMFAIKLEINNPPASLNMFKIRSVLEEALLYYPDEQVLIKVNGEEDLLLIPLTLLFSFDPKFIALYGQPGRGVVVIKTARARIPFLESILSNMRPKTPALNSVTALTG